MLLQWNSQNHLRDFRAFQRQLDSMFRDLVPVATRPTPTRHESPAFNIADLGETYLVEAELPGVREDDLQIEAKANVLTVRGRRNVDAPEGYAGHRTERINLDFARSFEFESKLDLEKITARLSQGLLRIELAKQAAEQPRTITVQVA